MNAEQIERSHNPKIESLDKFAPNVELGKMQFGGGAITAGIRGISYAEVERTFEPAVGVSVDGVFFGTGVGAMAIAPTPVPKKTPSTETPTAGSKVRSTSA